MRIESMWNIKPRITWQECWEGGNNRSRRQQGWPLVLGVLYMAALSMLSLFAAHLMAENCFGPLFVSQWFSYLWVALLGIPVILAWNETMYALRKTGLRLLGNLALLLAVFMEYRHLYGDRLEEIFRGMYGLGQRYLDVWNRYFVTELRLEQAVSSTALEQQLAWCMLLGAAAVLLQFLSAVFRERFVMLLLPVAVLAMGMFVGVTPGWPGMACMFAAGMLSLYLDRHRDFRPVPALLMAGLLALLLPLTAAVMEGPALRVNQTHDRLQTFQHNVERGIREYDWQALFGVRQDGTVSNRQPEYEHKELMTITVNEVPDANIYLRGYCGAEYQRGRWDSAEKAFDRACREQGLDSGEAALLLARLCAPAGDGKVEYKLQYTGLRDSLAYLPYGVDPETLGEQCKVSGDYVVEKTKRLDTLTFSGYVPGVLAANDRKSWDGDTQEFYLWYNEYAAEQYLVVSGDFPILTDIVDQITDSGDYRVLWERVQSGGIGRNEFRLALGSLVAERLKSLAHYNIDPGPLPGGSDPVEYFLGENRQGYCAHFASAGALLLRRLGVPARYVTGYVVQPGQFLRSRYGYRASVRDDAAHAWVEVWLDDVGWVPVEMTPGYEETEAALAGQDVPEPPLREDLQQKPDESETQEPETLPVPTAAPPENESAQGTQTAGPEDTTGESGTAGGSQEPNAPEGWGFAGEGGWAVFGQNGSLRVSHVLLVVFGTLAAAGMAAFAVSRLLRHREARWRKLWHDIESGGARRAVWTINRMLYRRLWRKRAGMLSLKSDEEYLEALKRRYPGEDWDGYLEVVRKAVYSREEISAEAAGVCYAMLKRVYAHKKSEK